MNLGRNKIYFSQANLYMGMVIFLLVVFFGGCGYKPKTQNAEEPFPGEGRISLTGKNSNSKGEKGTERKFTSTAANKSESSSFEKAQKKEMEITGQLEEASKMMKASNLDGALRIVQRIQQEDGEDVYVSMRVNYLKAMIYHRQKDPGKRKEAMNQMLKNMEYLQKDPRFQEGFEDGQANVDMIKMSIKKAGKRYGN